MKDMTVNDTTQPTTPPVKTTTDREIGIVVSGDGRDQDVAQLEQNVTKEKEFRPTPHMIVWLNTAIQLETDNISEISETCNIARKTWYYWLDLPGFIDWFKFEWDRKLRGSAWKLDAIGLKNARRDHKYWHDMQMRMGNLKDASVSVSGEKVIAILGSIKAE